MKKEKQKTPEAPKLLGAVEFRALAEFLAQIDYSQATLGAKLGLSGPLDYEAVRRLPAREGKPQTALDVMLRLFVLGGTASGLDIRKLLPKRIPALLESFGLLGRAPKHPGKWAALAMLYPLHDVWIVSDRWNSADGSPYHSFSDIVYPANANNTIQFLEWLPCDKCENFLELCAGTGVLALLAAKHFATRAWATDIAPRSVHFAEFNRRLNGLENVTVLQGDMFEPVRGLQFDRIVAHPPYMPSLKPAEVYYDGGPDGELITGTAIREVHQYLRPGGRLILQTLGTDRQSASFEQRIRGWLGSASDEFHLAIIARRLIEPSQFAASSALRDGGGMELAEQWKRFFRKSEIIRLVYGIVVLERRQGDGAAYSVHRLVGPQSRLAEAEWLMQWEAYAAHPRSRGELLGLRPVTSPRAELRITHRPQDGELQPAGALLVTEYPFSLECNVPAWTGYVLSFADGSRTVREIYEQCRERRFVHPETPAEEFAGYVGTLISGGFLELKERPLPAGADAKPNA